MQSDEEFSFAGIPTLFRSPFTDLNALDGFDVAVLGVPYDLGMAFRTGARYAPRAIRELAFRQIVPRALKDLDDDGRIRYVQSLRIADVGDIQIWPGDPERTRKKIRAAVAAIRRTALPLVLGGDHSITYSSFRGCAEGARALGISKIAILHFDADLDLEGSYLTMSRYWHGDVFRRLIEEGWVQGENLVSIGVRGVVDVSDWELGRAAGTQVYSTAQVLKVGIATVMNDAVSYLLPRVDGVYVTLDIDVVDPAHAPGTGSLSWGGLDPAQLLYAVRDLVRLPVIGFDLVEVSPPLDPSGLTSILARDLIWNFLAFAARGDIRGDA